MLVAVKNYDRKIKYLDEIIDGERVGGAGFIKAEVRGDRCCFWIQIKGLRLTDSFEKAVFLVTEKGETRLCKIHVQEGIGSTGELKFCRDALGVDNVSYEEIREIRIPLSAGRELLCGWQEAGALGIGEAPREKYVAKVEYVPGTEHVPSEEYVLNTERVLSEEDVPMVGNVLGEEDVPKAGNVLGEEDVSCAEYVSGGKTSEGEVQQIREVQECPQEQFDIPIQIEIAENLDTEAPKKKQKVEKTNRKVPFPLEDKWKQLWAVYPHIFPFEDDREYLSIGPSDFVILPAPYYRLVNNSFLLHGYHSYGHLILCRIKVEGEVRYYIGVPGNYYEKEKQVAVMFGFESFECKMEPADWGTYGYYMMRVEV